MWAPNGAELSLVSLYEMASSANFVFSCSWLHRSVKPSEANWKKSILTVQTCAANEDTWGSQDLLMLLKSSTWSWMWFQRQWSVRAICRHHLYSSTYFLKELSLLVWVWFSAELYQDWVESPICSKYPVYGWRYWQINAQYIIISGIASLNVC